MSQFTIIETNTRLLHKALSSDISDFEDAVIEVSAKEKNAEYIITRNIKDFKKGIVQAITPEELLAMEKWVCGATLQASVQWGGALLNRGEVVWAGCRGWTIGRLQFQRRRAWQCRKRNGP